MGDTRTDIKGIRKGRTSNMGAIKGKKRINECFSSYIYQWTSIATVWKIDLKGIRKTELAIRTM